MRAAARFGEPDEPSNRLWASFERRRQPVHQREPLKGPAFWNKAATTQQLKSHSQADKRHTIRKVGGHHAPYKKRFACPWLRKVVYLLMFLAITLFFVLISLISAYIRKASNIRPLVLHLESQQARIKEAVNNYVIRQPLTCVPCKENWMQSEDYCYLFTTDLMTWKACVAYCVSQRASIFIAYTEGEMLSILLETHNRFLIQNQHRTYAYYWIGLLYNLTTQNWHWADGAQLHLKLSVTEKYPSFSDNVCVTFHKGHEDLRKCTHEKNCLCKTKAV